MAKAIVLRSWARPPCLSVVTYDYAWNSANQFLSFLWWWMVGLDRPVIISHDWGEWIDQALNLRGGNWRQNSLIAKYNNWHFANNLHGSVCAWVWEIFHKVQMKEYNYTFHWSLATVAVMLVVAILVVVWPWAITLEILHAFLNLSHEECQIFIRSLLNWTLTELDQL